MNAVLLSWILNTIDPKINGTLTKYREAHHSWAHIKTRSYTVNGPCIQQLRSTIAHCEKPKNMYVSAYYGSLMLYGKICFITFH